MPSMRSPSPSRFVLAHFACAIALLVAAAPARAHGGAFNPVPTPLPTVKNPPTGPGPFAGNPGPATGFTLGASDPATDAPGFVATWEDWWHFNREPYLDLKRAIGAGSPATGADEIVSGRFRQTPPTPDVVRSRVLPALRGLLETEKSNEVVGSVMIALARAGDGDADSSGTESETIPLLVRRLSDANQETAETAALALGILESEDSLPILDALLSNGPRGRELVGGHEVPDRTRAFAAYGLGLVGHRAENNRARQLVARSLFAALAAPRAAAPDVEIAAVIALSINPLDLERTPSATAPWISRQTQIRFLQKVFQDRWRRPLVRAHAVTALARLTQDAPEELAAEVAEQILAAVRARSGLENEVLQSCSQALGYLGDADTDLLDRKIRNVLGALLDDPDAQTRSFAIVALAEVGSRAGSSEVSQSESGEGSPAGSREGSRAEAAAAEAENEGSTGCRNMISGELVRGRGLTRPWAAIALGILERRILDQVGDAVDERPTALVSRARGGLATSRATREMLRKYFAGARQRTHIGAGALALGLCRDRRAVPLLLDKLSEIGEDQGQGYVALALGMIGSQEAVGPLTELARTAKYRPALLESVATALALLGNKPTSNELAVLLAGAQGQSAQISYANALGRIGDDRAVDPLLELIGRRELTSSARGFAAAALGQVADKGLLPWFTPIATDLNYYARTSTLLAGDGSGLLEIL